MLLCLSCLTQLFVGCRLVPVWALRVRGMVVAEQMRWRVPAMLTLACILLMYNKSVNQREASLVLGCCFCAS